MMSPSSPAVIHPDISCEYLHGALPRVPDVAVILGSGLGGASGILNNTVRIPYADVPSFPDISVPGHSGAFLYGESGGNHIIFLLGRPHFYESGSLDKVLYPVRLLHRLGLRTLVITNAAGGLGAGIAPGALMAITDQIDLTFLPRGRHCPVRYGDIYDRDLLTKLNRSAEITGVPLRSGVYCGVRGPAYETRAEIAMLKKIGADAVGMSTVHETRLAYDLGMSIAGISVLANTAAGGDVAVAHTDVISRSAESARDLGKLIAGFLSLP